MCVSSEFQVDGAETENAREVKLIANVSRSRYVAMATQPVPRLQIPHLCTTRGHHLPLPQVTFGSVQ